jgi:hypothetical protein
VFSLTLYSDPSNLVVAFANDEAQAVIRNANTNNTGNNHNDVVAFSGGNYSSLCDAMAYSCRFLEILEESAVVELVEHATAESAVRAVASGEAYGMLHIRENFSMGLIDRGIYGVEAPQDVVDASRVEVRLDNTGMRSLINDMYLEQKE